MINDTNKELKMHNERGIKNLWRIYCLKMSVPVQKRVLDKVSAGDDFDQAIKSEGVILIRHKYDLSFAKEMVEKGELETIEDQTIRRKHIEATEIVKNQEIDQLERTQKPEFIPRPKPKKVDEDLEKEVVSNCCTSHIENQYIDAEGIIHGKCSRCGENCTNEIE